VGVEIIRTSPDRPWCPPSLLYNGYRVFPGGKERPGRDADPSPPSSAVVMKEYNYIFTPPTGRTVCTEPQCVYNGALYLYFYMHSIYMHNRALYTYINVRTYIHLHLKPLHQLCSWSGHGPACNMRYLFSPGSLQAVGQRIDGGEARFSGSTGYWMGQSWH
jgi:hypothetical protein